MLPPLIESDTPQIQPATRSKVIAIGSLVFIILSVIAAGMLAYFFPKEMTVVWRQVEFAFSGPDHEIVVVSSRPAIPAQSPSPVFTYNPAQPAARPMVTTANRNPNPLPKSTPPPAEPVLNIARPNPVASASGNQPRCDVAQYYYRNEMTPENWAQMTDACEGRVSSNPGEQ